MVKSGGDGRATQGGTERGLACLRLADATDIATRATRTKLRSWSLQVLQLKRESVHGLLRLSLTSTEVALEDWQPSFAAQYALEAA